MTKIILVANTEWYLYNFRLSLARFLRQQGFEILLVSPPGKYASLLEADGFRWIEWQVGRQTLAPWKELDAVARLARLYRQEHPDLVQHFTIKPVLYGSLAARLTGVRAIVNAITGRGYVFSGQGLQANWLRKAVKAFYRISLNHPNSRTIFENDVDRSYFISMRLVPIERTRLIEGVGVDSERFTPRPEPDGAPLIVLPARMLWDKGIGVLVDAARLLKGRTQARFALIGEPDPGNPASIDTSSLEAWHKEGVIEWWGWQQDMASVYGNCHIVTLPSAYAEGVPTALLEAAASGRPIVTTDAPGCRNVVKEGYNGYLVPPNDPPALADALLRLIEDAPLRQRMGAAGRQMVLEKFTSSQVNAATLEVYQQLLRG